MPDPISRGCNQAPPRPAFAYREGWQGRVPESLRDRDQWLAWRYELRNSRWTKVPYRAHAPGRAASTTDPQDWDTFEAVVRAFEASLVAGAPLDGVGFVFAHGGGLVGFDLDGVVSADGEIDPWGTDHLALLTPTYLEISPSGRGIKGFVLGELPGPGMNRRGLGPDGRFGFEMYDAGRFFTITAEALGDCYAIEDRSEAVLELYERYKPRAHEGNGDRPRGRPLASDDELLDRARRARNGPAFAALFDEGRFPGRASHSEADFSLCCRLAFWLNRDADAVDRVFRRSALMRDKWDEGRGTSTYGAITVANAIAVVEEVYEARGPVPGRGPLPGGGHVGGNGDGDDGEGPPPGQPGPNAPLPLVVVTNQLHEVVAAAVAALANDPGTFQRGTSLVRMVRNVQPPRGLRDTEGTPQILPIGVPHLLELLSRCGDWRRQGVDKSGNPTLVPHSPSEKFARMVADRCDWPGIPPLEGIVEAPTLRPDGTILQAAGYDPDTGLFFLPNESFPPIADDPTGDDARAAVALLLGLVTDFPFESEANRYAWLASCLTVVARFAIRGPVPLFLFDANTAGSGKTKLCDVNAVIATGRSMPRSSYSQDDDETRKQILSIALGGFPFVLFDNLQTGDALGGAALDKSLTSTSLNERILGSSRMSGEIPFFAVLHATGNNLGLKGDALRRIVPCRLESPMERPEEREDFAITGDLMDHVRMHRPALVAACLTIVRAYVVAGKPASKLTPMDYPAWSGLIRNAIHWASGIDPCATRKGKIAEDDAANELKVLILGWEALCRDHGKEGITVNQAIQFLGDSGATGHEELKSLMIEWSKNGNLPSSRVIGSRLKKYRGRVSGGKSINFSTLDGNRLWFVKTPDSGAVDVVRDQASKLSDSSALSDSAPAAPHETKHFVSQSNLEDKGVSFPTAPSPRVQQSHLSHFSHLPAPELGSDSSVSSDSAPPPPMEWSNFASQSNPQAPSPGVQQSHLSHFSHFVPPGPLRDDEPDWTRGPGPDDHREPEGDLGRALRFLAGELKLGLERERGEVQEWADRNGISESDLLGAAAQLGVTRTLDGTRELWRIENR